MAIVTPLHIDPVAQGGLSHRLVPAHGRRLCDKVLIVFHHACDAEDLDVAERLFRLLEHMAVTPPLPGQPERRLNLHHLVDAHERLLGLRGDDGWEDASA